MCLLNLSQINNCTNVCSKDIPNVTTKQENNTMTDYTDLYVRLTFKRPSPKEIGQFVIVNLNNWV